MTNKRIDNLRQDYEDQRLTKTFKGKKMSKFPPLS